MLLFIVDYFEVSVDYIVALRSGALSAGVLVESALASEACSRIESGSAESRAGVEACAAHVVGIESLRTCALLTGLTGCLLVELGAYGVILLGKSVY